MEQNKTIEETKDYIGMWVTKDGYIRHELLPNNRYDEARGNQKIILITKMTQDLQQTVYLKTVFYIMLG
jgi:hypothetical protein